MHALDAQREDEQTLEVKMNRNKANTRLRQDANKIFKAVGPQRPISDYQKATQSFHENRERLKAERLAREAAVKDLAK